MSTVKNYLMERIGDKKEKNHYTRQAEQEPVREMYFRQGLEKKFSNTCWCRFV